MLRAAWLGSPRSRRVRQLLRRMPKRGCGSWRCGSRRWDGRWRSSGWLRAALRCLAVVLVLVLMLLVLLVLLVLLLVLLVVLAVLVLLVLLVLLGFRTVGSCGGRATRQRTARATRQRTGRATGVLTRLAGFGCHLPSFRAGCRRHPRRRRHDALVREEGRGNARTVSQFYLNILPHTFPSIFRAPTQVQRVLAGPTRLSH